VVAGEDITDRVSVAVVDGGHDVGDLVVGDHDHSLLRVDALEQLGDLV